MSRLEVVVGAVVLAAFVAAIAAGHGALYGPEHAIVGVIVSVVFVGCILVLGLKELRRQARSHGEEPVDACAEAETPGDEMSPEEPPARPKRWLD